MWVRMNLLLPLDWDSVPIGGARWDGLMSAGGANTCPPAVNWQMASVALVAASCTGGAPVLTGRTRAGLDVGARTASPT